jgi:hypothetical protein
MVGINEIHQIILKIEYFLTLLTTSFLDIFYLFPNLFKRIPVATETFKESILVIGIKTLKSEFFITILVIPKFSLPTIIALFLSNFISLKSDASSSKIDAYIQTPTLFNFSITFDKFATLYISI